MRSSWPEHVLAHGLGCLRLWAWGLSWTPPYEVGDLDGDRVHHGILALGCFCGLGVCCDMVSGVWGFGLGSFPGPLPMSLRAWAVTVCVIGLRLWGAFAVLACVAIWSRACGALGLVSCLEPSPWLCGLGPGQCLSMWGILCVFFVVFGRGGSTWPLCGKVSFGLLFETLCAGNWTIREIIVIGVRILV